MGVLVGVASFSGCACGNGEPLVGVDGEEKRREGVGERRGTGDFRKIQQDFSRIQQAFSSISAGRARGRDGRGDERVGMSHMDRAL